MKKIIITLVSALVFINLHAQIDIQEYLGDNLFYIFDKNIHTLQIHPSGLPTSDPVIRLGYRENLTCSFDDFDFVGKSYAYTVYHCDPDWKISTGIRQSDYMSGYFFEDYIRDFNSSLNTLRNYMHYTFSFPNENIDINYSGNYALVVYDEEDSPDNPAFIARFYVTENAVDVATTIGYSKNPENLKTKQRVSFSINTSNYRIDDPNRNLAVYINQNDRQYSKFRNVQPITISGNNIIYDFQDKFEFNGNNEFRFAHIYNVKFLSRKIYSIHVEDREYHIYLDPEPTYKGRPYITQTDLNGKFLIEVNDNDYPDTEAEYAYVYFTLVDGIPFSNTDVYICGNFNGWQFNEDNIMTYNYEKGYYEGSLYLKQGYYDYTYIIKRNDTGIINETEIDGTYSETRNDYKIFVYYNNPGDLYYKLLSYTVASN
ncbi:MAG: DUF5103 domain-containing protein [Bacteroidales bacterium]|jgi:hypothetical protein|nr:DUF5103 domain-containing protein [Bacteroidales bacterium]